MERKGRLAFENYQTIIALKNNIGRDFLKLATLLKTNLILKLNNKGRYLV